MRSSSLLTAAAAALLSTLPSTNARRSLAHVNKQDTSFAHSHHQGPINPNYHFPGSPHYGGKPRKHIIPQNSNTTKFTVNGTELPFVHFDVGESYAGLLPISEAKNAAELFFWFFPTDNKAADDEILIWLNGGPGCSSLEGFLQENGPFVWQYGTYRPVQNPYTWVNLTNVVWVEYPAGTGFSSVNGSPKPENEVEAAQQFLGFWKNFMETFSLQGRKVYITGESYAGYYVPYISEAMHNETNKDYYNLESIMFYDPTTSYGVLQDDVPAAAFMNYWSNLLSINESTMASINSRADKCGYTAFMEEAMTFPPKGKLPTPPDVDSKDPDCRVWNAVAQASTDINPCWDVYQIATTCPVLWDVLGFPASFYYEPASWLYFNRADVQKAINAPRQEWGECTPDILRKDSSTPSGLSVLPGVIEKNNKTIIGHGMLDMVLIMNGTVMMINNMTFNGAQGFSKGPQDWNEFYVPAHKELNTGTLAGHGTFGKWHTERGLTFSTVELSGHMIPQYAPSAAYRMLEFLLGRIPNLSDTSSFTTQ